MPAGHERPGSTEPETPERAASPPTLLALPLPPSGEQVELEAGEARAVVTGVGGGIRSLEVGGRPVLEGYGAGEMASGGRGQFLAPWPNRLADGRYRFGTVSARAALDEPELGNAIHGLVRWMDWHPEHRERAAVTMATELPPQPGYPWRLGLALSYELACSPATGATSLTVTVNARNLSGEPAPFGAGFHPYVHAGAGLADACEIEIPASLRLVTDDRGLPLATAPVRGTEYDFTRPRPIGSTELDTCYTGLVAPSGAGGLWVVSVRRRDGSRVTVSGDAAKLPYVMCYTGDTLPAGSRRRGIAIEPMSCPPNALATGDGLVVLEPGGSPWTASWEVATGS